MDEASSSDLHAGLVALAAGQWEAARDAFERAVDCLPDDSAALATSLDGLGEAFWWLGRPADAIDCRIRAYGIEVQNGSPGAAARIAVWLSAEYGNVMTNAEIAGRLFISVKTAGNHVSSILTKLGLRSRAQAAAYAVISLQHSQPSRGSRKQGRRTGNLPHACYGAGRNTEIRSRAFGPTRLRRNAMHVEAPTATERHITKESKIMPKANKKDIDELVEAPGFQGRYAEALDYTVGFETYNEETDLSPLFVGLPDDACQCEHLGYVIKGSVTFKTADGDETFSEGDAYVVGPGHTPVLHPDTEIVEFSPTAELNKTMAVVMKNMDASG